MLDFELAAINAFKYAFPNVKITSCFFHFGQNIFKKIVSVGLKEQYKKDINMKNWVRKIIAPALVPIDDVEDVFVLLLENKPYYPQIDEFCDYFKETYIQSSSFPLTLWNHFEKKYA